MPLLSSTGEFVAGRAGELCFHYQAFRGRPDIGERIARDEVQNTARGTKRTCVLGRHHLRMFHPINGATSPVLEYDGIAGMNLLQDPEMSIPMPGDDAVAILAGHRGTGHVAGAAPQIRRIGAFYNVDLRVQARDHQLCHGIARLRPCSLRRSRTASYGQRHVFEFARRTILTQSPLQDISCALKGEQHSSANQQIGDRQPDLIWFHHRGIRAYSLLRNAKPILDRVPPASNNVNQSADVDGSFSFFG